MEWYVKHEIKHFFVSSLQGERGSEGEEGDDGPPGVPGPPGPAPNSNQVDGRGGV